MAKCNMCFLRSNQRISMVMSLHIASSSSVVNYWSWPDRHTSWRFTGGSYMVVIIFDGHASLLSKLLRHTISLNYLSANTLVFLHKIFELRFNLLLSQLLGPLLLAKLVKPLEQLTMLPFDFVLLDKRLFIFLLARTLLALESSRMTLQLVVLGAHAGALIFQVRKLPSHGINLLGQSALIFLEDINN